MFKQAQEPGGAAGELGCGLWSGKLKHRMATQGGYSTVDLLNLTALIPDRRANLPPFLRAPVSPILRVVPHDRNLTKPRGASRSLGGTRTASAQARALLLHKLQL